MASCLRYPSVSLLQSEAVSVTKIESNESNFEVQDASGNRIQARKLILATGVKEIFPEIDGFAPLYGRSLFNCVYCDGWELRDQPLVIVSEHASGFHTAKLLYQWSRDIVVCTNGHSVLSTDQKLQLHTKGIKIMEQRIASFIGTNGLLEHIRFVDGTEISRSGGFVTPKFIQSTSFAEQLGCELSTSGGIMTEGLGKTTIPGVYAAGDAVSSSPSQVVFAAADGSRIAMRVNQDLSEEDFEQNTISHIQ